MVARHARLLDIVTAALGALTLFLALTGGGKLAVAGIDISARDWKRPAVVFSLLIIGRAAVVWRAGASPERADRVARHTARIGLGALGLLMPALWLRYLVTACGGLDSTGYVGASALLGSQRLSLPQPEAAWLPFERGIDALAPLGFVPAPDGRHIVPRFPLGLPLVMALFRAAFGENGPFYVAPVLGTAAVILTGLLVKRVGGSLSGGLAAVLLAANPLFVAYAIQPMSDVPATFWLVLSAYLMYRETPSAAIAGMAAGMAMLTRPPLLVAALVVGLGEVRRRPALTARFGLGLAPWVIVLVALHSHLYGSPLMSGYGTPGVLFSVSAVPYNALTYAKWLLFIHTPIFVLLAAAAWLLADRRFVTIGCLVFLAVAGPYLLYTPRFDDWEMLRFLLPGLAFLVMLSALGTIGVLERFFPKPVVPLLALTVAGAAVAASYTYLQARGVFGIWSAEARYPAVASWFARNTDERAIVLASLHSGSIRHYSGRLTMRWDAIPPDRLTSTVAAAADRGRPTFLVLDGAQEREQFAGRFGDTVAAGLELEFVGRVRDVHIARVTPAPAAVPSGSLEPRGGGAPRSEKSASEAQRAGTALSLARGGGAPRALKKEPRAH